MDNFGGGKVINASGITKNFGDITAVKDLSFAVNKGEIFGIVGPDGAGKSTLLRIISTILKAEKGNISIHGLDTAKNAARIKEILAYMPQRFGLYEDLTVQENIFFFGRLFGVSNREIKKRLDLLYDFSKLGPFHNRLAGKLSGGMKQKLGLACCLVHKPELILLDEPTNGVDPISRREFWRILYDLLQEGVTILVSTAYLDEAERCNRVALMHEGQFIHSGTPSEIKSILQKGVLELILSDSRKGEQILKKNKNYKNVIRTGVSIKIFADNIKMTREDINKIMKKNNLSIITMNEKVPSLEDCFMELVSHGPGSKEQ